MKRSNLFRQESEFDQPAFEKHLTVESICPYNQLMS